MMEGWRIVTHGGAGSDAGLSPVTEQAAERARERLEAGADALEAACEAVALLEDDGRFNAGEGSYLRADGETVQMDAACADSTGAFGAVACIEDVRNPVHIARAVKDTEHLVLADEGARAFAREQGVGEPAPGDARAKRGRGSTSDTVGCVLGDGDVFAAALSSGGTEEAMVGRVGDVPLPGCGLRAGPAGAVAATGHGESIVQARVADRAYEQLADGRAVDEVVSKATASFEEAPLGLIAVDAHGCAGASNRSMAYSVLEA